MWLLHLFQQQLTAHQSMQMLLLLLYKQIHYSTNGDHFYYFKRFNYSCMMYSPPKTGQTVLDSLGTSLMLLAFLCGLLVLLPHRSGEEELKFSIDFQVQNGVTCQALIQGRINQFPKDEKISKEMKESQQETRDRLSIQTLSTVKRSKYFDHYFFHPTSFSSVLFGF